MTSISSATTTSKHDDRILPITRIVSAIIVPFLVLAFLILYFYPDESGQRFAWAIHPRIQAMYVGAGYLGGGYLFLRAIFGRSWHRVAPGFFPVTAFTISMLLLTILHWDRFDLQHFPFQLWLVLYIVTPILVPWAWFNNRQVDPGDLESGDILVPIPIRWLMRALGAILMVFAVLGFIFPSWLIELWPWTLDPLSARAVSGWLALLGVGGLAIAGERRWSSWRIGLESIAIWHILVLIAAALNPADFIGSNLFNWYIISVVLVLVGMAALYGWMESRQRRDLRQPLALDRPS